MNGAGLCDEPNKHAPPAGLELLQDLAVFHGYQQFSLTKHTLGVSREDGALRQKRKLLAHFFTPRYLASRTVLDLGANAGFYSFWALQNGAEKAICVDIDQQYLDIIAAASKHVGLTNLEIVNRNVAEWDQPADVVLALALVHWLFCCTATYGSLPRVLEKLASLTKYMLVVEWVCPDDPAIQFFHHIDYNPDVVRGPYTREAFEDALAATFARFEVVPDLSPTRKLYVAFRTPFEVDLSGPLPLLQPQETVISSRWLGAAHGVDYWSCVYDRPDEGVILKQATLDLAEREYQLLSKLDRQYFPRPLFAKSEETYSVAGLEKVQGVPLAEAMDSLRSDFQRLRSFVTDCLDLLGQLAQARIEHRDIRPDNILVRGGKPVLIDFGWAVFQGEQFVTPSGLGHRYSPQNGIHSDVYSMGKVLGEINQHRYPALDPLIELMTEEDPSMRVTDVAALKGVLALASRQAAQGATAREERRGGETGWRQLNSAGIAGLDGGEDGTMTATLLDQILARNRRIGWLLDKLERLDRELETERRALSEMAERLAEKDEATQGLTGQLEEHRRTLDELTGQLVEKDRAVQGLTGQLEEHRRTLDELTGQLAEKDRAVQGLNGQLEEQRRALSEMAERLVEKDEATQGLTGQLEDQRRALTEMGEQLAQKDQAIRGLTGQLVEKDRALAGLSGQLEDQRRALQNLNLHFEKAILDLRALQRTRTVRISRAVGLTLQRVAHRLKALVGGGSPIQGAVDLPEQDSSHSGSVVVSGWAFSTAAPVTRVEVLEAETNTHLGTVSYGLDRPDVLKARPWQNESRCGYSGTVRLDLVPPGFRTLITRVTDGDGNRSDFTCQILVERRQEDAAGVDSADTTAARGIEQSITSDTTGKASLETLGKTKLRAFLATGHRVVAPPVATPLVSIVMPTFNQAHYTFLALESLLASEREIPFELIIVDNGSTDGTRELLDRLENVRLHLNESNLGFGGACNLGAQVAGGEYLCFLNTDVVLSPGWLTSLVETIRNYPGCGAVGAKLVHLDGTLQEAGSIIWQDGSTHAYGRGDDPLKPEYSYVREVDYCSAACLLVRRDLFLQLGGFDERYAPAYYEDTDLCTTVREAGYRVVYQPDAVVVHLEFGSGDADAAAALQMRNRERFRWKWPGRLQEQLPQSDSHRLVGRDRRPGRRILVVDDRVPQVEFGSGFPRTLALLRCLADLGYLVTYLPRDPSTDGPVTSVLQRRGIEVLHGVSDPLAKLRERANLYDVVIISRPHNAEFIGPIRRLNPRAAIVYDAEAVYALRDARQARVDGHCLLPAEVERRVLSELAPVESVDLVMTVSELERRIVRRYYPRVPSEVWGHAVSPRRPAATFDARQDLLFVGYLATPPNADAVSYLLTGLFPSLRDRLQCRLFIVGADPSSELVALASDFGDRVALVGPVKDLAHVYDRCRVFVAPHRFAAGIPLKVLDAMANGIPCVVSQLLADQLEITHGDQALIGDDPDSFVENVTHLYHDVDLWQRIQQNALLFVQERYDPLVMKEKLRTCIEETIARKADCVRESREPQQVDGCRSLVGCVCEGSPVSEVDGDLAKTATYWSNRCLSSTAPRDRWQAHPVVQEAMRCRHGGLELTEWLAAKLPPRALRAAGLGVGTASGELSLLRSGAVETFDLYDIAPKALEKASQTAALAGLSERVRCHVADINRVDLRADSYDLITFFSSLHHVTDLVHVLGECRQALRPGGVFFAHEYVGPDRFAFPPDHVELACCIYRTLDPKLRCPWPELPVPSPADVEAADPSEAVRSSAILGTVREYLPDVEVLSSEVALTIILWYGLNHDAVYETSEGYDLVRWLLELDQALIRSHRLWSYHATFMAVKW